MASINYLLYESAAGYAVFKVENQADSVGLQLKEVQSSLQNLATFGKHVKLVSFAPYQYVDMNYQLFWSHQLVLVVTDTQFLEMPPKLSRTLTSSPKASCPTT